MTASNRKFQLYPDNNFHSISELETALSFKFLGQIDFETADDEKLVKAKGIEKWKSGGVSPEAEELGAKFIEKISSAYIPAISIRRIDESIGHGLFAEQMIHSGDYVGEYTGIVRKNDRRYFEPLNNYCYEYPVPDEIGRSYVIDATQGNLTRFINHSSDPNLKPVHIFYQGFYHLVFLAIRFIEKGEQLTFDYGQNYWNIRSPPLEL